MKKLEIVCLGNNGRSPIAEAVFRDEAKRKDVDVEITSSGLYVARRHPFWLLKDVIEKALKNPMLDIYGAEEDAVRKMVENPKTEERYANDPEFREQFLYYLDQTYRPFQAMDVALRNNVLTRHGLRYESERHQFPSREELDYVFTATRKLVEPAKELVKGPIVTSLGELTGTDDIKGGFGKFDINFYEGLYEGMRKIAPVVLEKVMEDEVA
jgi:hypothetical protein